MRHFLTIFSSSLALAFPSLDAAVNVNFPSNPVDVTGTSGTDGYMFRFNGVADGLDVVVTNVDFNNANRQLIAGGRTTEALGGDTSDNFVIDLNNNQEATDASGFSSTRMRLDFVNAGAVINGAEDIDANRAAPADYIFTFYDIDSLSDRRRIDQVTAFGADGYYVETGGLFDPGDGSDPLLVGPSLLEVNHDAATGATSASLGASAPNQSTGPGSFEYSRYSISFAWTAVQSLEFEWGFTYTQKGTRGVELDGSFPPDTNYVGVPEFTPVPEPSAFAALLGLSALAAAVNRRSHRRAQRS